MWERDGAVSLELPEKWSMREAYSNDTLKV